MLARGKWRATGKEGKKEAKEGAKIGFHLSSLYSPVGWYSWKQAVEDYLHAKENEQLLKVWINTTLGETWVDKGEVPDWKQLFERRENFPIGMVPKSGKIVLTAGVDVQKDRFRSRSSSMGKKPRKLVNRLPGIRR
ncbi:phage tail protein [Trichonephila clavata]|uniref:Phage tail protein n=1 Tax=Trichonephila clavata TaxID=2740835 RepID=A0A8X6IYH9_TRICU|nr:phage tail protein [Trichonephila clavata]